MEIDDVVERQRQAHARAYARLSDHDNLPASQPSIAVGGFALDAQFSNGGGEGLISPGGPSGDLNFPETIAAVSGATSGSGQSGSPVGPVRNMNEQCSGVLEIVSHKGR